LVRVLAGWGCGGGGLEVGNGDLGVDVECDSLGFPDSWISDGLRSGAAEFAEAGASGSWQAPGKMIFAGADFSEFPILFVRISDRCAF